MQSIKNKMIYNDELLKFLKSVMDDLESRGEKRQISRSLMQLHDYCGKDIRSGSFSVKDLNELFTKCKDDLYKLYKDGYLPFKTVNHRQDFFDKMTRFARAIVKCKMVARHYNDVVNNKMRREEFIRTYRPLYLIVSNAIQRMNNPRLKATIDVITLPDEYYLGINIERNIFAFVPLYQIH